MATQTSQRFSLPRWAQFAPRSWTTWLRGFFALFFLALGWVALQRVGIEEVATAFAQFGLPVFGLGLLLTAAQGLAQGVRLWLLFPIYTGFSVVLKGFIYGQALNMILPARVGDVAKISYITRRCPGLATTEITGILVSDKLLDVLLILGLALFIERSQVLALLPEGLPSLGSASPALIALGVVLTALGWWVFRSRPEWIHGLVRGLRSLSQRSRVLPAALVGVIPWLAEATVISIFCQELGYPISLSQGLLVLVTINLAISIPISAANIGPFEAAVVFALSKFGIPLAPALAVAALHHLFQILVPLLVALLTLGLERLFGREDVSLAIEQKEKQVAVAHYLSLSTSEAGYEGNVNSPILRIFRQRERGAVQNLLAPLEPEQKLLDVGCGSGVYSRLAKARGLRVTATDIVEEMIRPLQTVVDEARVMDIESADPDGSYDVVVCAGVLDFVTDPARAFENLCGFVKPGGKLVVLAPRIGPGGTYYRFEKRVTKMRANLFTTRWFDSAAKGHGLKMTQALYPLPTNMALRFDKAGV